MKLDTTSGFEIRRTIVGIRKVQFDGRSRLSTMHIYSGNPMLTHVCLNANLYYQYSPYFAHQFNTVENGIAISKLTQVFSKQAPMMDALISHFAEQMRRRRDGTNNQPGENLVEGLKI